MKVNFESKVVLEIPKSLEVAARNTRNIITTLSKGSLDTQSKESEADLDLEFKFKEKSNPLSSFLSEIDKKKKERE